MDSAKFNAMLKAVECGSLTKAAEQLGYTQAGLTHMMTRLESEVGFKLIKRNKFGVELTPDGQKLLPLIEGFVAEGERLRHAIEKISSGNDKTIRIAAYASIAANWLPTVISRFTAENPVANFEIHDGNIGDITEMVCSGEVEIGFASRDANFKHEWIHLHNDPLLAVLPKSHTVYSDRIPIEFFEGKHFFIPNHGVDHDVLRLLEENGVTPNMSQAAIDDSAVVSMVSHGLGFSILSQLVTAGMHGDFISKPLAPQAHRELGMMIKSKNALSPIALKFISCCKATVAEMTNG